MNLEEIARLTEKAQNILGVILEGVGGVVATVDDPLMAAAVGIEAAAEKLERILLKDRPLPGREDDRPAVLESAAMLREECGPAFEIAVHHPGVPVTAQPYLVRPQ